MIIIKINNGCVEIQEEAGYRDMEIMTILAHALGMKAAQTFKDKDVAHIMLGHAYKMARRAANKSYAARRGGGLYD